MTAVSCPQCGSETATLTYDLQDRGQTDPLPKDQTYCPKCRRMYCEGFWGEGVCIADMSFCGEPTADGDEAARCLRVWYEAHRETWWERSRINKRGQPWAYGLADDFMIGMMNEVARIGEQSAKVKRP